MPVDIKTTFSNIKDKITRLPMMKQIMGNPLITALIICLILFVIVVLVFRQDKNPFFMAMQISIYTFLFSSLLIFLNNNQIMKDFKKDQEDDAKMHVFNSLMNSGSVLGGAPKPVESSIGGFGISEAMNQPDFTT